MAERTLGQVAYEAYRQLRRKQHPTRIYYLWDELDQGEIAAWEAAATAAAEAERERLYAELGNDHYVIFTEDRFTVEHSVECKLGGHMHECTYHAAIAEAADEPDPEMFGRWRITGISEGLPDLERTDG